MDDVWVGPFCLQKPTQRQLTIMKMLCLTMTEDIIRKDLIPLVTQESDVSLRALDWLVTNYSKKYNIVCKTQEGNLFNIYHGYKIALTHFRRRHFDPFRRRDRIKFMCDGKIYESTVGQSNFVNWAHHKGVLQYALCHTDILEKDMNMSVNRQKQERLVKSESGLPHRRRELSKASTSKCSVYKIHSNIRFDMTH